MQAAQAENRTRPSVKQLLGPLSVVPAVFYALIVLIIIMGFQKPSAIEPANLLDFTRQAAMLGIVALGQTIVMISGGLDLSVGSVVILIDVVAAQLINNQADLVIPVILLCLLIGVVIGAINGFVVTQFRVAPFITTLGMNYLALGAALVFSSGAPRGGIPQGMRFWGNGFILEMGSFKIPAAAVVWTICIVLVVILARRTTFGRYLYAVGANQVSARLSGVRVKWVTLLAYVASGVLAAVGGLLLSAYIGVGTLKLGDDYMLNSIAAAVVGGTPFEGGRGSIAGTVGGSLFMYVLFSVISYGIPMTDIKLESGGRLIAQGIIFIVAVALYALRRRRS